jgi:beta-galactosidase
MKKISFNLGWNRSMGKRLPWEDDGGGTPVDLPDDFALELPRSPDARGGARVGFLSDGYATYLKCFEAPADWQGKTVLLHIDGAYMNAEVSLNKDLLAMHPYGYTPFEADLTGALRYDLPNRLSIVTHGNQPSSRWYSGAGLYRQVEVWLGEPCYLLPYDLFMTTPEVQPSHAVVHIAAAITNSRQQPVQAQVQITLRHSGAAAAQACVAVDLPAQGKTDCSLDLTVEQPALWDDVTPNLYDVCIRVQAPGQPDDITHTHLGIRKVEVNAQEGFRLNGRPLTLHGGCIHHDNGILGARALPVAEWRKIRNLKAAGFNAIRTAHNPPSEALLDACDHLGMLVIDEFFDCWRLGKNENDYHLWFEDWWRRDIESTVRRDRNHPSIYCWSFGNEIAETRGLADGEPLAKAQAAFIRSLDNTRLVTCGGMFLPKGQTCDGFPGGPGGPPSVDNVYVRPEEEHRRWAAIVDCLDVVSLNYSFRNYAQFASVYPNKALQGTETEGIDAWGNREAVRLNPHVIGDFMWTAHDNLGEAGAGRCYWEPQERQGLLAGWPWLSCFQGDLALDGERLPRSYYRKVIWGLDPGIHLFTTHPAHTGQTLYGTGFHWHDVQPRWTFEDHYVGQPVDVEAYADCDEVAFLLNGDEVARVIPSEMIARATLPYCPGALQAVAYRAGQAVAQDVIETTGPVCGVQLHAEQSQLAADGMDLCYVSATLVDEAGRRVYGADMELSATVSGPGTLAGFGSNNPCTEENFGTGKRLTWFGRAMLILRAGQQAGEILITVTAPGLPRAELAIPIQ